MPIFSRLRYYLDVYRVQLRNNLIREAVYRANFFTTISMDFAWIVVEFMLFTAIYSSVTVLAGWTKEQVFFFLGMFFASDSAFTMLMQRNFWMFSDLVTHGELDLLLTKPIHPLFLALTRWISVTSIFNVGMGIAIMFRFAEPAGFAGGSAWLLVLVWMLVGFTAQAFIRFIFAVLIFWTDRNYALIGIYFQLFEFGSKPDTIYPYALRFIIRTLIPFAFIGSVPARALLGKLEPYEYLMLIGSLFFFMVVDTLLWRRGLRRYQSASS